MNAPAAAVSLSTDKVIAGKAGGVGYLRLNQPEKHNAISYAMWIAIAEAMESFRNDGDVRVVVMSGEGGRAFSAGADISEFQPRSLASGTHTRACARSSTSSGRPVRRRFCSPPSVSPPPRRSGWGS